jgi:uncharacterized membrane protein
MQSEGNHRPVLAAGTLLGIGMGGFVDGIVFHQILQVHNMLSARYPKTSIANIEINMVWDGIFHAFCWLMVLLGLGLLWNAGKRADAAWSGRTLVGAMLFGWGLFNLIEGILDHHLLHLHHVIERLGVSIADYAFLLSGVVFMLIGQAFIRAGRQQ